MSDTANAALSFWAWIQVLSASILGSGAITALVTIWAKGRADLSLEKHKSEQIKKLEELKGSLLAQQEELRNTLENNTKKYQSKLENSTIVFRKQFDLEFQFYQELWSGLEDMINISSICAFQRGSIPDGDMINIILNETVLFIEKCE
jgi:hypothetical protein